MRWGFEPVDPATTIDIPDSVVNDILKHAYCDAPNECCGLLIGSPHRLERVHPARNLVASPTRYLIDPADHFAAIHCARTDGLRVVGTYHSHPLGPPVPSMTDLRDATYPDYVYVIVSPRHDFETELEGYHLRNGGFEPVTLRPVG